MIQKYPNADIAIGIVWIKMNDKDTFQAAQNLSETFNDPRVTQFYDPLQRSGKIYSKILPINAQVAWDIYLFYGEDKTWDNHLSEPDFWMHQMRDTDSDSDELRCGDDLVKSLYDSMRVLERGTPK
ncbi:MAG: hypothetical protein D3926_12800 [Desulfobacteraceae bacterium]|nr:MAG: hypothetical protein D3926_12800 [Desulfobacteraceae bacterium]